VAASGYDGTKAVILSAGDNPIVMLSASGDHRRKIADEIEREAFASVPYVPLRQIKQPTV